MAKVRLNLTVKCVKYIENHSTFFNMKNTFSFTAVLIGTRTVALYVWAKFTALVKPKIFLIAFKKRLISLQLKKSTPQ